MNEPFEVLFEDQHLLVLSKAPGLLSQGESTGDENLVDLLRIRFGRNYVGLVHRLDRNTSGLMVVAKRSKSAERLTEQLQDGRLIRKYHAILWGNIEEGTSQIWEHSLLKNKNTNEVKAVKPGTPESKIARLKIKSLKNFDGLTFAQFELETGRSHQIRVQSAVMNYPLVGDTKYGSPHTGSKLFHRPALHSFHLSFFHPISDEQLSYSQDFSQDFVLAFPKLIQL